MVLFSCHKDQVNPIIKPPCVVKDSIQIQNTEYIAPMNGFVHASNGCPDSAYIYVNGVIKAGGIDFIQCDVMKGDVYFVDTRCAYCSVMYRNYCN